YINSILNNYFDNITLIYINKILTFLLGSKKDYLIKVHKVIEYLIIVKFYLDSKKYESIIKSIKYFSFIIIVSVGI
ncbi:hypothetical protein NEUTE2DRAFT_49976, partial [Neurospora tetrasperma FGSC 2509]